MQRNNLGTLLLKVKICEHGITCVDCCWPWQGQIATDGYSKVSYLNDKHIAHSLIYKLVHNLPVYKSEFQCCHKCDTKICCNWHHIYKGSHQTNMQDKVDRNRQTRGMTQPGHKLNDTKVYQLRRLWYSGGWKQIELATLFDVSQPITNKIINRKDWSHLLGEVLH